MKVNLTILTVFFAPLVGVLIYLGAIGQFEIMADAEVSGLLGFIFFAWIVATLVTVIIGLPLGFGFSALLRRFNRESLLAYLLGAIVFALVLAFLAGEIELGLGITATAVLLAAGYWFGVAKPRVEFENG